MSLLLIVPFSEIESCGVIPSFYITMRKPKTFQGCSLMYSIKKSHVFCFGQTGLILVGQLSRIGGMGGGGVSPPPLLPALATHLGQQEKEEAISFYPFYHFHSLHRHLDISWIIAAESSPLRIADSQARTENLWFPNASR